MIYWLPLLVAHTALTMWLSVKANEAQSIGAVIAIQVLCLFQLWAIIAYYSKNIIFDALVYDLVLILSSFAFLVLFGKSSVTWTNCAGIVVILAGLVIFKYGDIVK